MHTPLQGGFHSSLYQSQVLVRVKPFYVLIFSHLRFDVIDRSAEIACTRVRKFDEEPPWNKRNRFYQEEEKNREEGEREEKNEYQRVGVRVLTMTMECVYYGLLRSITTALKMGVCTRRVLLQVCLSTIYHGVYNYYPS